MASRKLIILSLFAALPVALLGETANDYAHHSAQDYIFGDEQEAKRELTAGLLKFPEDPELRDMLALFKDKQQDKDQDQKQQQQQQQGQQSQQQDQKDQQQQQSQDKTDSGQNQNQEGKDQSQAKNDQQKKEEPKAGETPSPSPGEDKKESQDRQSSPGEKQAEPSPTPGEGEEEPSPSPGEGDESGDNVGPSPSASPELPQKKFAGEVKEAPGEKSKKPQDGEMAAAEPEKEGELSERQAEALLQSMKDEEARVQLDERKASRHVYNDW
jgi:hypothetical protein